MISRRTLEEWISTFVRIVGIIGVLYEIFARNLENPTAIIVLGGLAGLPDVLGYRQSIKQQVEKEVTAKDQEK
jgi:hypothetical protein